MTLEDKLFESLNAPLNSANMRRAFLLLMRVHFSSPSNYGQLAEQLGGLIYTGETGSPMDVELMSVFNAKQVNPRPGVFVGLRGIKFTKQTIDNFAGSSEDGSKKFFEMKAETRLLVRHVAQISDMSSVMADTTTACLFGMREILMKHLGFTLFDILGQSEPTQTEQAPERAFQTDVECNVAFQYALTTNIESHRIKKVVDQFTHNQ